MFLGKFPQTRQRRLRQAPWLRYLVQENDLEVDDLILPIFLRDESVKAAIPTMPGVYRYLLSELDDLFIKIIKYNLRAVALFPCTPQHLKNDQGMEALNPDNLICQAIRYIKKHYPNIGIITDVALDPYTDHGHDGILDKKGYVDNDLTVQILMNQALNQARAGTDILAPSDMMDGRIKIIRSALDKKGFSNVLLLSYAAKYASAFYGPFREAVGSKFKGDKKTYQLNPANRKEAMAKIALDLDEGADMIIVKPGMPYLDILYQAYLKFNVPLFAYQVSGEYAMIKWAAQHQAFDENLVFYEACLAFKRAGACGVITYAALEIAEHLCER